MNEEDREPPTGGPDPGERGETEPLLWACTRCGYHVEGAVPERCPECGAGRDEFDEVPKPGF